MLGWPSTWMKGAFANLRAYIARLVPSVAASDLIGR